MLRLSFSLLLAMLFCATSVRAADSTREFPAARPIRLVCPFAPASSTDVVGRMIAPRLADRLGQNVVVENRPGAGGMIGASYVAKATPDGHTLLFISGAFVAHSAVSKNLPYDPLRDFSWISVVLTYPFVVVVRSESTMYTIKDLIEAARKSPRSLNYGSVGTGSVFHLAAELFGAMTGTAMTHVPFKGSAEPTNELMAGRLDVIFTTTVSAVPHMEAKRLRALAITSLQPWPLLPHIPTVAQTIPGYEVMSFNGIGAPRATPRPVIARLNREIHSVLDQQDLRKRLIEQGNEVQPTTPEEMTRKVASEMEKWRRIVAERRIEVH